MSFTIHYSLFSGDISVGTGFGKVGQKDRIITVVGTTFFQTWGRNPERSRWQVVHLDLTSLNVIFKCQWWSRRPEPTEKLCLRSALLDPADLRYNTSKEIYVRIRPYICSMGSMTPAEREGQRLINRVMNEMEMIRIRRGNRSPVYRHPHFVIATEEYRTPTKRFWLKLRISEGTENLLVILKNPSRASKEYSDKTIFTLTNYIDKNRLNYEVLADVGVITIVNLIPLYETDSRSLARRGLPLFDIENVHTIDTFSKSISNVIVAWGNAPSRLDVEYRELANRVTCLLKENKNSAYYVDRLSVTGYPKHAQVWGYDNKLNELAL